MPSKKKNVTTSEHQPSLTEWFKTIGDPKDAKIIQQEDGSKNIRLEFLRKTIGLPYLQPTRVEAIDLFNQTVEISEILKKQGKDLCAIRLIPKKANLSKIRNRGMTLDKCYNSWFLKQKIDFKDYQAEICPHAETVLWSMIIVVNRDGIFGEMISGHGFQLMHGDVRGKVYFFKYNFSKWTWSEKNKEASKHIKKVINHLKIKGSVQSKIVKKEMGAQLFSGYLEGYFEAVVWPNKKEYFSDYNRILQNLIATPKFTVAEQDRDSNIVFGFVAFPGIVIGKVQKVTEKNISKTKFRKGSILVTDNTDVRFLPIMKKAGAIVTERGSILSHASIIARELKKPCMAGVKNVTKVLKDGDLVKVDAHKGIVKIIKNN
ncbi:MAG: hypothetical protein ACD_8C00106G0005 [uncultured bacterium]|nr:MAG: hypothetical protein ACD_8C00106G0005 [uncultured bacterium]